ncbi:class I SAM-dependent methyltransferase [Caldicellulosiruptoraceae bacterium PP1]
MDDTIRYYDENALDFFQNTKDANMKDLYAIFLSYLPEKAKILDLGCGSGRDTKYFLDKGYDVVALDGSIEMVKLSSEYTGRKTLYMKFEDIDFHEEFDGIWACASLLHVSRSNIDNIFKKIYNALKKDGILFASFKYGNKEEYRNGRFFNYYDQESFTLLINNHPYFEIVKTVITTDVRQGRENEKWFSAVLRVIK